MLEHLFRKIHACYTDRPMALWWKISPVCPTHKLPPSTRAEASPRPDGRSAAGLGCRRYREIFLATFSSASLQRTRRAAERFLTARRLQHQAPTEVRDLTSVTLEQSQREELCSRADSDAVTI
jgi:hypothetical protein